MEYAWLAMPFQLPGFFYAKEDAMSHLAIVLLIVGAFALILGTVIAVRAHLENRGEEMATFRRYFGPEYDRDLLRQSSWSDNENPYDRQARLNDFNARERGTTERYSSSKGTIWRNRDRD
jgi:hypothetical protein